MKAKSQLVPEATVYVIAKNIDAGFVPGLPARITRSEASDLGLLYLLEIAIAAGAYVPAEE